MAGEGVSGCHGGFRIKDGDGGRKSLTRLKLRRHPPVPMRVAPWRGRPAHESRGRPARASARARRAPRAGRPRDPWAGCPRHGGPRPAAGGSRAFMRARQMTSFAVTHRVTRPRPAPASARRTPRARAATGPPPRAAGATCPRPGAARPPTPSDPPSAASAGRGASASRATVVSPAFGAVTAKAATRRLCVTGACSLCPRANRPLPRPARASGSRAFSPTSGALPPRKPSPPGASATRAGRRSAAAGTSLTRADRARRQNCEWLGSSSGRKSGPRCRGVERPAHRPVAAGGPEVELDDQAVGVEGASAPPGDPPVGGVHGAADLIPGLSVHARSLVVGASRAASMGGGWT